MSATTPRTLGDFLSWAEQAFIKAKIYFGHGTNNAWDEAVALAMAVLDLPSDVDASITERLLTPNEDKVLTELAQRRIKDRIPLPYLSHVAWFSGLKFYVDENVIIPRSPLAEVIEHRFQPWWGSHRPVKRILDLCTGSGCIAIACAYAFPGAEIDAVDISKEALSVARKNVSLHHCENQLHLLQSDLFQACSGKRYDIIISNPPYVSEQEMGSLPKEYQWEPPLALVAGQEGLAVVEKIINDAPNYLNEGGLLIVEVGNSQEALQKARPHTPFIWLEFEHGGEGVFLLTKEDLACG